MFNIGRNTLDFTVGFFVMLYVLFFMFRDGDSLARGDNILRPILVGKETRMPDYLVLLATLGGLVVFGLNGFVIGPVIAALFLVS